MWIFKYLRFRVFAEQFMYLRWCFCAIMSLIVHSLASSRFIIHLEGSLKFFCLMQSIKYIVGKHFVSTHVCSRCVSILQLYDKQIAAPMIKAVTCSKPVDSGWTMAGVNFSPSSVIQKWRNLCSTRWLSTCVNAPNPWGWLLAITQIQT